MFNGFQMRSLRFVRKLVEHVDCKRNIWLCSGEKYEFPNHVLVQENVNYWGLHVRFEFQTKMHGNYSCITLYTSLNPVPNAQVCVHLTVHITKLQLQTTFPTPFYIRHSACVHGDPGRRKS